MINAMMLGYQLCLSSDLTGDSKCKADEKVEREAWEKVLFCRNSRWLPAGHSTGISRVSICSNQGTVGYPDMGTEAMSYVFFFPPKTRPYRDGTTFLIFLPNFEIKQKAQDSICLNLRWEWNQLFLSLLSPNRYCHLYLICIANTVLQF